MPSFSKSSEEAVRESLGQERIERLFAAADRLAALDLSPLTKVDVEAEIQAARARGRAAYTPGR